MLFTPVHESASGTNGLTAVLMVKILGALMVGVTSEGLVRIDNRKSRSAGGDCEGDRNKYEDFFHGRILSKKTV
jgi:hypothetical protein